ncbi:MAG TPA: hypothetical protein EYP23_00170, partial [Thermoplasmata archaeon]|nr:hypothetical protein [Thermoplasmata archaeon]
MIRTTINFAASFSMRFTFYIYEIRISVSVSGVARGSAWAVISINLKTGEIYMRYGYSMKIYAVVYGIYAEGTDVSIPTKRFKLHMETFVLDARSAAISIRLDGFNIMTARFSGRIPATVEIRNLTMMSTTDLSEAPMMLSIERIYAKGDFLIWGKMDRINIEGDGHLDVQNLRFNVVNAADSNLQFNIDAFIDSISLDSGRISITIENVLSTPEVSITFTGSSVEVSDIEFSGNVIIPGIPGEENNQFSLDFEGSVDSVVLEDGELSISLRLNRDLSLASLNVEGSGVITVSNISLGGEAGNETTTFGSLSASIDIVTLNGDFSVHYDNGDLMIEASATLTIEDIEIGGEVMNTSFNASVTTVNFTAAGSLNVYSNGTVEAECEGSLVVDGITVSIGEEEITIENINIEFGGKLVIHPGETEDEPPIYEVNGHVEWNITGDIESEGNVTVDANVTIQFDKFDDGNFTINISFDGEINMNVSLNGATPGLGNFSLNIENYSGDGMFEFYWNTSEGKIYLNNSMDASWDSFYFNVADGFIEGEIYEFTGDITIENLFIDQEALREMRDDPRNWTIKSENGYDTVLGFSFSSNGGLNLEGDIYADLGAYLDLSIRRLHC